ncbi:MAG: hypothetical protein ACKVW3_12410 [Phycisphaerales bacterium]
MLGIRCAIASIVVGISGSLATAGQVAIRFDNHAAGTPVTGLATNGVAFGYVGNAAAHIALNLPGANPSNRNAQIVGETSGILTLAFDQPTSILGLRFSLNSTNLVLSAATINLYDTAGSMLASVAASAVPNLPAGLTAGSFAITGMGLIKSAQIQFAGGGAPLFSIDDLEFEQPESVVPLPTPLLLGVAGLGLALLARRRWR